MAAVDVGARDNPPINDDLDNPFNDYGVESDLYKDVNTSMDVAPKQINTTIKKGGAFDGALGLDEEIKVAKKRAPIAKLDERRLLSQAGIPKLRRITKERLRFKGKGHEFSDTARLLNLYQLWLDDLYPRAKFADGLAMIEKLGHSKRMQVMRKEWISEGKAKSTSRVGDGDAGFRTPERRSSAAAQNGRSSKEADRPQSGDGSVAPAIGGSIFKENCLPGKANLEMKGSSADDSLFLTDEEDAVANGPPEDDLDAIFAEETRQHTSIGPARPETFVDDEEAMADFDDMW